MLLVGALLGLAPAASAIPLTGDPSGESVAVFQPLEDPGWPLYSAIRSAGGPFRSPVKVATPPIKSTVVAGNGSGGAIVAWTTTGERIKPTSRVAAAVRAPGKRRFGAPRIVSPESGWATGAAMNGNGDALVLYLTARYPENDLFFSAWRAAGDGTVTPPQVVPTARDDAFEGDAAIALDDRGEATSVAVAESQPADGSDSTYGVVSSTSAQGATWTAPAGISSRLTTEPNPVGIAENGKGAAIAFWAGRRGAEFARREPGQGFTRVATPVRLDPDVFFDADVVGLGLGEDGTGVFAYRSGGKLLASLSEAGSPWSPPRPAIAPRPQVEHPLGSSEAPVSAAVGADGAVAVAYRSPNCSVYGAYRPPGGRFVSSLLYRPRSVERMCDQPGVIIGGGRATAAWQQSDGARVRAVARDFGAGGASRPSVFSTLATYVREGRRSACWPRRSTTIARNDVARVFVRKASRDEREVEGCFFRRGARVSLQSIDARTGRPFFILNQKLVIALAGPLAAYVDSVRCSGDCDETDWENKGLFIDDLRGGTANFADVDDEGEVEQIVLNPRGSAAWIQCSASCSRRGTRRTVYLLQFSESSERRVSQGPGVAAKSLRLRGQTVTWVENGRVRRTRLR